MKKWISIALATFCMVSFVEATTLEEYNKYISEAKNSTFKQVLTCERETAYIYKDPQQCIKAVDMLLEMSKKATKNSLLRCELFGIDEEACKLMFPDTYKKTDKEFFNEYIANSYVNVGVIYDQNERPREGADMYKKAIKYDLNSRIAHKNLGILYYFGQGVAMNKIKAYEHWIIAAKQGDQQAQKNLDALCNESPWVCKK